MPLEPLNWDYIYGALGTAKTWDNPHNILEVVEALAHAIGELDKRTRHCWNCNLQQGTDNGQQKTD